MHTKLCTPLAGEMGREKMETGEKACIHRGMLTLASESFEELVKFYQMLLGQTPHLYAPENYAEFAIPGGLHLAIFTPRQDHRQEFAAQSSGGMSLCLEVGDLERAIAHLESLEISTSGLIVQASHGREIYAYDPDGNRLILYQSA